MSQKRRRQMDTQTTKEKYAINHTKKKKNKISTKFIPPPTKKKKFFRKATLTKTEPISNSQTKIPKNSYAQAYIPTTYTPNSQLQEKQPYKPKESQNYANKNDPLESRGRE